jgi:hypothetical protein
LAPSLLLQASMKTKIEKAKWDMWNELQGLSHQVTHSEEKLDATTERLHMVANGLRSLSYLQTAYTEESAELDHHVAEMNSLVDKA